MLWRLIYILPWTWTDMRWLIYKYIYIAATHLFLYFVNRDPYFVLWELWNFLLKTDLVYGFVIIITKWIWFCYYNKIVRCTWRIMWSWDTSCGVLDCRAPCPDCEDWEVFLLSLKTEIDILQTNLRDWILRLICENVVCCILCWLIDSDWYKEACVCSDIFCIYWYICYKLALYSPWQRL